MQLKHNITATPISPKYVSPFVERLLDFMNAEFDPEIVPVVVESYATPANCFPNVQEKIKRDGGKIHYGWAIWQHNHIIEAEHHAVWEDDNENLLDITPQKERYETIMFLPDNTNVYNGQMGKPNVRLNISGNRLVDDFIVYANTIDLLYGMATRIDNQRLSLPEQIVNCIQSLEACKQNVLLFYASGNNNKSKCFCGSTKPYDLCQGQGVKEMPSELIKKAKEVMKAADSQN
jgi:hypothetical protein